MDGFNPREGTTYSKCLSSKLTSYVIGYMNMIICTLQLVTIIFQPCLIFEKMNKTEITVAVILSIASLIFAAILLIGLHKNKRLFIMSFLIFCGVYVMWITIGTVIILFTRPSLLGFRGFFLNIFTIMVYIAFFCVIRFYNSAAYT